MNTEQNTNKNTAVKALAIIGLISVIALSVWGAVQLIRVIPSAFSSLASVAETIYSNRPIDTLTVATDKSIVNAGETFTISWTDLGRTGIYTFYFQCVDGVSVDLDLGEDELRAVRCSEEVQLPAEDAAVNMTIYSERRRFVDVPFTIAFSEMPESSEEPLFERNSSVTVVNATIPQSTAVALENGEEAQLDDDSAIDEEEQAPEESTPESQPTPQAPQEQTISYIPESHEDGFTDLKVTYRGVGTLRDNVFTPTATLENDERVAFRFEVKNIGTKTSQGWTFDAQLPGGSSYNSDEQEVLRPNERAVYTLGFDLSDDTNTAEELSVTLDVSDDTNSANDSFTWSVEVN